MIDKFKLISGLQEELDELQAVVDAERDKLSQQRETIQREMTTKVTEVESKLHCIIIISPWFIIRIRNICL